MHIKGIAELISILEKCESIMKKNETGEIPQEKAIRQIEMYMQEFQEVAERARLVALRRTAREIEKYVKNLSLSPDELTMLAFALSGLKNGLAKETVEDIRVAVLETFEILGFPVPTDWQTSKFTLLEEKETPPKEKTSMPDEKPVVEETPKEVPAEVSVHEDPIDSLVRATETLGVEAETEPDGSVVLRVVPENLSKVQRLLAPADPEMDFGKVVPAEDELEKKVLAKVKEFMVAFSVGDFQGAEEILEELASIQEGSEIFGEIGKMARHLHTAFKDFAKILDPALRELAVDYLPDSEGRLRYLMKLTEEAANTTLDCTERMRERAGKSREVLKRLRKHIERLKPIGHGAEERMFDMTEILVELENSWNEEKEDVDKILAAQNFQDLGGQTVLKVLDVMQELQDRLVNAVKTFGVKIEGRKKKEELLGPAHDNVEGVLRSQDEVDSLLAQFGF